MPIAWRSELESLLESELRDGAVDDPFRPAVLRWAGTRARPDDHAAVLESLERVAVTGRGVRRFRWRLPVARWVAIERRVRWRPAEAEMAERNPTEHANRLWLPIVVSEHLTWLHELKKGTDPALASKASQLLEEALPAVEDHVAASLAGTDAWGETFLLWAFGRQPRTVDSVHGLVLALAARYAARAGRTRGIVRGRAFPFFDEPLPSATGHLATAAAILGEGVSLVDRQIAALREDRRPDGGWGDPRQPSDLLTTLAAARLLGSLDPAFDPGSVVEPLRAIAARTGPRPELIGPEWPWVAAELVAFLDWAERPFTERFRWPTAAPAVMDPRVDVPRFEGYLALGELFAAIPALGDGLVEVAFIDLANFGKWNGAHGQERGDELLALLCRHLKELPRSRTFRDGGDEYLVVGAPQDRSLEADMHAMFDCWPAISAKEFATLPVVPLRAVVSLERASDLRAVRGRQGEWIGKLKHDWPAPPPEGVIRRYELRGTTWWYRDNGGPWEEPHAAG